MLSSARASSLLLRCARGAPLGAWRGARRYVAPAVLSALGEYGARHGHVRVPKSFVVPDGDDWAGEAHGLQLGKQVSKLRAKKQKGALSQGDGAALDALGFVWSIPEWQWQRVLQSLAVYKELHGDLEVPYKFVVPSAAPWPAEAWGLKLGSRVELMMKKSL